MFLSKIPKTTIISSKCSMYIVNYALWMVHFTEHYTVLPHSFCGAVQCSREKVIHEHILLDPVQCRIVQCTALFVRVLHCSSVCCCAMHWVVCAGLRSGSAPKPYPQNGHNTSSTWCNHCTVSNTALLHCIATMHCTETLHYCTARLQCTTTPCELFYGAHVVMTLSKWSHR